MPNMTPVADQIRVPDPNQGVNTFASILGLQQQRADVQSAQARASVDVRSARERQALAGVDWSGMFDENGEPDEDRITKTALGIAPTTGAEFAHHMLDMSRGAAETKKSFLSLNDEYQGRFRGIMGAYAADPQSSDTELGQQLDDWVDSLPRSQRKAAGTVIEHSLRVIGKTPPEERKRVATSLSRAYLQPSELGGPSGLLTPDVALTQGPQGLQPVNVKPTVPGGIGPVGGPIAQGLAPTADVLTDANGRKFVFNQQTKQLEPVGGTTPAVAGAPKPAAAKYVQPIAGQETAQAEVDAIRNADTQYGQNRFVNDSLMRLSKDIATGPGTKDVNYVKGVVSSLFGGNSVAPYQEIEAYLDRQSALLAQQMGVPNTNAGLATAAGAAGTTQYQPKALQAKVRLTDAMLEGAHQYRQGLDKVVGTGGDQDLRDYRKFQAAWAANFDPTAAMVMNAQRRGDKEELREVTANLSDEQRKVLAKKARNLAALSRGEFPE
jgi:hypothetical protein